MFRETKFLTLRLLLWFICPKTKAKLKGHENRITCLAFSYNLNVLVSSAADAQVVNTYLYIYVDELKLSTKLFEANSVML